MIRTEPLYNDCVVVVDDSPSGVRGYGSECLSTNPTWTWPGRKGGETKVAVAASQGDGDGDGPASATFPDPGRTPQFRVPLPAKAKAWDRAPAQAQAQRDPEATLDAANPLDSSADSRSLGAEEAVGRTWLAGKMAECWRDVISGKKDASFPFARMMLLEHRLEIVRSKGKDEWPGSRAMT